MSDLDISIGFLDDDIIALANDIDDAYSFIAIKGETGYTTQMKSENYGLVTHQSYALNFGSREMILSHLAYHLTAIKDHHKKMVKAVREKAGAGVDMALN